MNATAYLIGMPALTLKNPWAHLIAHYGKTIENRNWMPPESLTRVLIHAGKSWDDGATGIMRALGDPDPIEPSAIVAVADLAHACDSSRHADVLRCGCDPRWAQPGQCHWVLANVRALAEPVPCSGRQGLWRPTPDVMTQVAAQLGAVTG